MAAPSVIARFNDSADALLERVRGNPVADGVMNRATNAAEFSRIWHVIGLVRALVLRKPLQAVALSVGLGAESLIVNQGLKRLFRRARPTTGGDERYEIRAPSTSSFPSGHASSAFFAATVLTGWDGKRSWWWYGPIAAVVALSRPYVRIHHASDIVGGSVVGVALGLVGRAILRRIGLMSPRS